MIDYGDLAGWISLAVSVPLSIAALITSRRAVAAAERQATAAEKALPPPPPDVDWKLDPRGQNMWALRNTGTKTATGVEIKKDRAVALFGYAGEPIPAGGSIELGISGGGGVPAPRELWVSWDGHPEPKAVPL